MGSLHSSLGILTGFIPVCVLFVKGKKAVKECQGEEGRMLVLGCLMGLQRGFVFLYLSWVLTLARSLCANLVVLVCMGGIGQELGICCSHC